MRVVTNKLDENGLPRVAILKHDNDPVEVPDIEDLIIDKSLYTKVDNCSEDHNHVFTDWIIVEIKELVSIVADVEELKKEFINKAMATGFYTHVEAHVNATSMEFIASYYTAPTIEEIVDYKKNISKELAILKGSVADTSERILTLENNLKALGEDK